MLNRLKWALSFTPLVAGVLAGCRSDKVSITSATGSAAASTSASSSSAAASVPSTFGIRLETVDQTYETRAGKLPDKLSVDGPAAALMSSSPFPEEPRKWLQLVVFPKGTDPATICASSSPGPTKKDEYVLGLDLQYDGELKVGPAVSIGSPSIAYVGKNDDRNITSSTVGKQNFVDIAITAVTADSVSVTAKAKPGAAFKLEAAFTAKICKKP